MKRKRGRTSGRRRKRRIIKRKHEKQRKGEKEEA